MAEIDHSLGTWMPAGQDGQRYLLVDRQSYEGGDTNAPAIVRDMEQGKDFGPKPLQLWFKWGNWLPLSEEEWAVVRRQLP